MSITDELRKWGYGFCGDTHDVVTAIADRIDAEHETTELQKESYRLDLKAANIAVGEAYNRGYDEGFASADDWLAQHEDALAEHDLVRLPKDADGEYIHVEDMMERGEARGRVIALMLSKYPQKKWGGALHWGIQLEGEKAPTALDRFFHHYHAPTVEDVLTEFGIDWEHESDCEDRAALLKEYAAKLRLAGDEA